MGAIYTRCIHRRLRAPAQPPAGCGKLPYMSLPPATAATAPAGVPATAGVNVKAIWSLPLAVAFAPLGLLLAHLARQEIRRTGERGAGLARTALIIGYPVTGVWLVFWVSMIFAISLAE